MDRYLTTTKTSGAVTVQLDDKLGARLNSVLSRIDRVSAKFEALLDKINEDYGKEQNADNLKQLQRYVRTANRLLGRLNGLDGDLGTDFSSKLGDLLNRSSQVLGKSQGFLTGVRQQPYGASESAIKRLGQKLSLLA